jgi:hypothetical protein
MAWGASASHAALGTQFETNLQETGMKTCFVAVVNLLRSVFGFIGVLGSSVGEVLAAGEFRSCKSCSCYRRSS